MERNEIQFSSVTHPTGLQTWVSEQSAPSRMYSRIKQSHLSRHDGLLLSDFTQGSADLWGRAVLWEESRMWTRFAITWLSFQALAWRLPRLFPWSFQTLIRDGCHLDTVVAALLLLVTVTCLPGRRDNESVIISNISVQPCLP